MQKAKRSVQQIIALVKRAAAPRNAPEVVHRGALGISVIRLAKDRFVVVRDVVEVDGVQPGNTNAFFRDALEGAAAIGLVTRHEVERVVAWQRDEEIRLVHQRSLDDVLRQAERLGLRLVKKRRKAPR